MRSPARNGLGSARRYQDWIPDSQYILLRPYFQSVRLEHPLGWNDTTIEIIVCPPNMTRVATYSLKLLYKLVYALTQRTRYTTNNIQQ